MPKRKIFTNAKSKSHSKEGPVTADEYLEAGVGQEEAGQKWLAGDATKALRFFMRALETYDVGLQKYPKSFDIAYNKARLQYEICQRPKLLAHLPTPLIDLLKSALASHRDALEIDQDNSDLLFNIGQVLTNLVETMLESKTSSRRPDILNFLREALELFQRCLSLQEFKFDEAQTTPKSSSPMESGSFGLSRENDEMSSTLEKEVWALVEEPITKQTLLETVLAQLEVLTTICSLGSVPNQNDLAWIEDYYRSSLADKINAYSDNDKPQQEVPLSRAKFVAAISDAAFRSGRLDAVTYERELNTAFSSTDLDLDADPQGLCEKAEAYLSFNTSIQSSVSLDDSQDLKPIAMVCWKQITKALDSLTAASRLPNAQNLAQIHLKRGDCELMRYMLGQRPFVYDLAVKSKSTLVKNAEVYYHGAAALAKRDDMAKEELREAEIKLTITIAIGAGVELSMDLGTSRKVEFESVLDDMKDDTILSSDLVDKLATSLK